MFEQPEFMKAMYGFISAVILGVTGTAYREKKRMDAAIEDRPTHDQVEDMINSQVQILNTKQDYTIKKLDEIQADVNRLENIFLNDSKNYKQ